MATIDEEAKLDQQLQQMLAEIQAKLIAEKAALESTKRMVSSHELCISDLEHRIHQRALKKRLIKEYGSLENAAMWLAQEKEEFQQR